jgi:RNA polymerase sigma-70 factor (ECF subfamily)
LVTQFQRGDRTAFEKLVHMWERSLFYYLRRLAPSEADTWDLLQETWLKVFRSLKSMREPRTFPAFLYATARHAAISKWRRAELEEKTATSDPGENSVSDYTFVAFDDAEQVHHALDQLPLLQREAVTLYFLEDLSIDEIAQVLGVAVGTVKSRLHYGKQAIRKIISDGDDHGEHGKTISRAVAERSIDDAGAA